MVDNDITMLLYPCMIVAVIVILALIFRISFLGTIEFKADEAVALFIATRPLFGHPFVPGSLISSFGILNPPLFIYLLYPLTLVSQNPKWLSAAIGIINALSIGSFYLLIATYYKKSLAIITSLLLAFSPWAIIYSRKIWAQDFIIPLSIVFLWSVHKIIVDKKYSYWMWYGVSALLLIQIHQASLFFVGLLTFFLLITRPNIQWRKLIVGILLGSLPLIPYLVFEYHHHFESFAKLLSVSSEVSTKRSFLHFIRPFQILSQGNFYILFGSDIAEFAHTYPSLYQLRKIFYLEYVLLLLGILFFYKSYPKLRFLVYTTVLLPFIYFIAKIQPEMHYYIIVMPLLFLFLGCAFLKLWHMKQPFRAISIVTFLSITFISIAYNYAFFTYVSQKKQLAGDYGASYKLQWERTEPQVKPYEALPDYNEIVLAYFIPPNYMTGDAIFAQMLYDFESTKNNLPELEQQLLKIPIDARIYHELFAYYTREIADKELIETLREKREYQPAYQAIYNEVYGRYLHANFKKEFQSSMYPIIFEYPEHWQVEDDEDQGIIIKGDDYTITIHNVNDVFDEYRISTTSDSDIQLTTMPESITSLLSSIRYRI